MDEQEQAARDAAGISGWSDVSEEAREERAANDVPRPVPSTPEEAAGISGRTDVTESAKAANAAADEHNSK